MKEPRPRVGVRGSVQHLLADGLCQRCRRVAVDVEPVGSPRKACITSLQHRHGAVLHGNAGVLGLRAFVVDGRPHQAGQKGRGR